MRRRAARWGDLLTQFVENMTQPRLTPSHYAVPLPVSVAARLALSRSSTLVSRSLAVSSFSSLPSFPPSLSHSPYPFSSRASLYRLTLAETLSLPPHAFRLRNVCVCVCACVSLSLLCFYSLSLLASSLSLSCTSAVRRRRRRTPSREKPSRGCAFFLSFSLMRFLPPPPPPPPPFLSRPDSRSLSLSLFLAYLPPPSLPPPRGSFIHSSTHSFSRVYTTGQSVFAVCTHIRKNTGVYTGIYTEIYTRM